MAAKKYYHDVDLVKNSLLNARVYPVTTAQRTTLASSYNANDKGILCFDTTELNLYVWDGNNWKLVNASTTEFENWNEAYDKIVRAISVQGNVTQKVITLTAEDGSTVSTSYEDGYIHDQGTPATTWTITHNLNKYPAVTVVDTANTEVIGEVQYTNTNTLTVTFSSAFSGKAYLN